MGLNRIFPKFLLALAVYFNVPFVNATPFHGYIVKFKGTSKFAIFESALNKYGALKQIHETSFGRFAHLETSKNLSQLNLMEISQNPNVEYIEPNYIISLRKVPRPLTAIVSSASSLSTSSSSLSTSSSKILSHQLVNQLTPQKKQRFNFPFPEISTDKDFNRQWGLHNDGSEQSEEYSSMEGEDLNILKAWSITTGSISNPIKIAVVDTGIDYKHPELINQMDVNTMELQGQSGIDDDGNGFIDDIYGYDFANNDGDPMDGGGHGTHCAGVIGASHNSIGTMGVMANVKLVALKFLTDDGNGEEINAIRAIDYAIKRGVKVLSNSWGGTDRLQALEDAIAGANRAGLSFVAAAGNDAENNDGVASFPANFIVENIISVGSFNAAGDRSSFSNFGKKSVHVMAPGSEILSTYLKGNYEVLSGTSMATPHVAGVIGLLLSKWPDLTPLQIRNHLMSTVQQTSTLESSCISGGRVDAYRALTLKPN